MKRIYIGVFFTFVFTFGLFFLRSYFLWGGGSQHSHYMEELHIESLSDEGIQDFQVWNHSQVESELGKKKEQALSEKLKTKFSQSTKIGFYYYPGNFESDVSEYNKILLTFLESKTILPKIKDITVGMHEKLFDVRGKMKDKALHFFGVLEMNKSEFLSVGTHEFAHYVDLYFLRKSVIKDISNYFYDISWESTKVMKPGSAQENFVSGYAMTNKYEDFAESFTYYILHNKAFLQKAEDSLVLQEKYNFFKKNIFKQEEFIGEDFSLNKEVENYYRDITKIDFDLEKLLIFLEKGI